MPRIQIGKGCFVTLSETYTAESEVPTSYLDWHQYASDMSRLGIRQVKCVHCGRYSWPKELTDGKCQCMGRTNSNGEA